MSETLLLDRSLPRHEQIFDYLLHKTEVELKQRSIEDGENDEWVANQEYSHSTRMIEIVGELALKGALETQEGILAKESLRERFESSIIEMLHTDDEFREKLEINRERHHLIRSGSVMALDGKTGMLGMIKRGAASASLGVHEDVRMSAVADRCAADVRVAEKIENLPVGSFMVGLSVDPKEAMALHGKKFYTDKGFREGLAFLQWYVPVNESTLLAATYSVDESDLAVWREVWAEFGRNIPANENTDTWLDHDISMLGNAEDARRLVENIRARFYEKKGIRNKRYSVDEFLKANQLLCDEMFETLYMRLPIARETGSLDDVMRTFATGMLSDSQSLKPDIRNSLSRIVQTNSVSQDDVALLEQLTRYAVTEKLRGGLAFVDDINSCRVLAYYEHSDQAFDPRMVAADMGGNVINGARANRTYGGCTKSISVGNASTDDSSENGLDRPQDAFGGQDNGSSEDAQIPANIRCIKCRQYSPKSKVIHVNESTGKGYWECPHCSYWKDVCTNEGGYRGKTGAVQKEEDIWRRIAGLTKDMTISSKEKSLLN